MGWITVSSNSNQSSILMVQGTTSDAGKSTLVAGLCRYFARKGVKVAPFKPQNMALNSAVTADGGEIGRAQALQAVACGLAAHTDFNPILLKPCSDTSSQVIVQGKALSHMDGQAYFGKDAAGYRTKAMAAVLDSLSRLIAQYELVMVEGAGSPAEINLREGDIANMGFAEEVDCPVILIADIDKGGVFAHIVGTLALLSDSERARVKGVVINRFRGDIGLLQSGLDWLEAEINKPVLGVLPYLNDLHLDAEDALMVAPQKSAQAKFKVLVLVWPRISNHTDFDALRLHPDIEFNYVTVTSTFDGTAPQADLIILPGSKSVRQDLTTMLNNGWDKLIKTHLRYGGKVIGICGGYQMLGLAIDDPLGVEGAVGESDGLGLLPIVTELTPDKRLAQVSGCLNLLGEQAKVSGYEIHCGRSKLLSQQTALMMLNSDDGRQFHDGCLSSDGQILGTYLHGVFDTPEACRLLLSWAGMGWAGMSESGKMGPDAIDIDALRQEQLDRLADMLAEHMDMQRVSAIISAST
ncbi:cobyric acid synthase [Shewanella psychrotolerans]|uniref:cobyric acid synthase n=1 Tax=Shewanella psychrotolerans TaxID=2864206 RepID=UPI001C65C198|nr:cobyric acid synthase [Shewanella psychrotolerans]QYK02058.1 cobyric acid synthase [Shewanella psychrotolerans]